jgi:hypothetical protein
VTEFDTMRLVYLLAALVLVTSAFWGQRFEFGKMLRLGLMWAGIFLLAYLIADNRHAIGQAIGIVPEETTPANDDGSPRDAPPRSDIVQAEENARQGRA